MIAIWLQAVLPYHSVISQILVLLPLSLSYFVYFSSLFDIFFYIAIMASFIFICHQPDVGSTKSNLAKSRPSTLSTNNEANSAKRPSPTTANKKSPAPKATTPTAAKRPPAAAAPNRASKVSSQHKWIPFVQTR